MEPAASRARRRWSANRRLTGGSSRRILKMVTGTDPRRTPMKPSRPRDDLGEQMSSEHVTERVPLQEIREGDMLQDPRSGKWIKVTGTADRTNGAIADPVHQDGTAYERYRVYYGDGGEEIDSRRVPGLVNRQVRE